MTQIQAYENMSKEALIEHHKHTLQQHADDMDMLSKELAARPKASDTINPEECAKDVFANGVPVGLFDIPKETANYLCDCFTSATGVRVDWHYIGGRVHIKALPSSAQTQLDLIRFDWENVGGHPHSKMLTHDEMRRRYAELSASAATAYGFVSDADRTELITLLRRIRPSYGDVGSRDVDVAAQQMRIDRAIELLTGQPCTCPSGNGSLRWPCPVHPPETDNLTKSSNQQV